MHDDLNLIAIEGPRGAAVGDVREHGIAHGKVGRRFELQEPRQRARKTAGIEHEARLHVVLFAGVGTRANHRRLSGGGRNHFHAVTNFDPLPPRFVRQQFVEVRALHLERRAAARREAVAEIEIAVVVAADERCAVLELESGCFHCRQHAGFFDEIQAVHQQAFADREARKMLAFEHEHVPTATLQQGRSDRAGRARTDDDDIAPLYRLIVC